MGKKRGREEAGAGAADEQTRRALAKLLPQAFWPRDAEQLRALLWAIAGSSHRVFTICQKTLCLSWHFSVALSALLMRILRHAPTVPDDLNV